MAIKAVCKKCFFMAFKSFKTLFVFRCLWIHDLITVFDCLISLIPLQLALAESRSSYAHRIGFLYNIIITMQ